MSQPAFRRKSPGLSPLDPFYVSFGSAASDAFGRHRVSEPLTVFDSKQIFDNQPLFWDDSEESGSGTTSTHSTDTASTTLGVSASTAGKRTRQTFMRFNYQPGKSQLVMMTFVMDKSGGGTDVVRTVGLGDDQNGLFLVDDEGTYKFRRRTYVTGSAVDNDIDQADWDDKMDGTGASGVTLDFSKSQILAIDFEWLGVGTVRYWFVVDGVFHLAHTMNHANSIEGVYMSNPNLPLRYQIEATGTGGAASTLEHICSTVISEGGVQDTGRLAFASTSGTHVDANSANTVYAVVGLRLKSDHVGADVRLVAGSLLSETNDAFEWIVYLNPTVAGTFTYSSVASDSCMESALGATANTVTGGTVVDCGFASVSASVRTPLNNAIRLGAAIDGTRDEMVLCVRPLSSNADIQGSITWREAS